MNVNALVPYNTAPNERPHHTSQSLVRRAKRIQFLHASRLFTSETSVIPKEAAKRYSTLIAMATDGSYTLTNVIPNAIRQYEAAINAARQQAKTARSRRLQRNRIHCKRGPAPY